MKWLANPPTPATPNRLFQFSGSRGIVMQHDAKFKSSTRTGGGGGYLHKGTGYIFPVWSQTDHVHWQEFWLRTANGREAPYWLEGYENVKIRQGHEVGALMANGTLTHVMNYSTGTIYSIAPLDRLLPLHTPMGGCAITALTLFIAPFVGFVVMLAIALCIGLVVRATIGVVPESQAPAWRDTLAEWLGIICVFGTMVLSAVYLTRQSRRAEAENNALRTQGRQELDAACQRCLGLKPVL